MLIRTLISRGRYQVYIIDKNLYTVNINFYIFEKQVEIVFKENFFWNRHRMKLVLCSKNGFHV